VDSPTTKHGKGNSNNTAKLYLAAVGSRPPNPSLMVDLAGLELTAEDQPRPEALCKLLNRKLGKQTPSQVRLG
jgi:hypothetical protein